MPKMLLGVPQIMSRENIAAFRSICQRVTENISARMPSFSLSRRHSRNFPSRAGRMSFLRRDCRAATWRKLKQLGGTADGENSCFSFSSLSPSTSEEDVKALHHLLLVELLGGVRKTEILINSPLITSASAHQREFFFLPLISFRAARCETRYTLNVIYKCFALFSRE
jgi:hypothetical protein